MVSIRKPVQRTRAGIEQRFWAKVRKTADCWYWTGAPDKDGYGTLNKPGSPTRKIKAHRFSFMLHYGPIHDHVMVLHRCDEPSCVRPDHLFDGDAKANAMDMSDKGRGREQSKEICVNGHPRTPENSYTRKDGSGNNRQCRACDRERKREARATTKTRVSWLSSATEADIIGMVARTPARCYGDGDHYWCKFSESDDFFCISCGKKYN